MKKFLLLLPLFFCLMFFSSCTKTVQKSNVKETVNPSEADYLIDIKKPEIPDGFFKFATVSDGCFLKNGDMCFIVNDFKNEELLKKYYDGTESCAIVFFDRDFNIKNCIIPKDVCRNENSVISDGEYIYICTVHTLSRYDLNGKREDFIPIASNENNEIFISDKSIVLKSNEKTIYLNSQLKEIK